MNEVAHSEVQGVKMGSQDISYIPQKKVLGGNYKGGSKTASSITLMIQSLLPTLLFGQVPSKLNISGGTDVNKSPPSQSIKRIFQTLLSMMNIKFQFNIIKPGYYPMGGGEVELLVEPIKQFITPITLIKNTGITSIYIEFLLTHDKVNIKDEARSIIKDAKQIIKVCYPNINVENLKADVETRVVLSKKFKNCYGIIMHGYGENMFVDASYFPDDENLTIEQCAEYCSQNFVDNIKAGGCLDIHHQDQLLLYMALAKGKSQIRVGAAISDHTQAVIYILQKFLPQLKTSVMPQKEKDLIIYNIIEIEGIAYENK
eukprot:TRINITY_DN10807_c0_g1_i2.p1 TRINITY_DN10807_c0_g1~~TRINITY_DN10807_c0_g1_i2.p1  ORF type:complete len:315 (+),score=49.47 TRINITY_DN10807_c0_g1_i2:371-1315(+)